MQPRKVSKLIKRAGEPWVFQNGTEAGRFFGVLPTGKATLSVAEVTLAAGDVISRVRDPRTLFLVTDTASNRYYSKATLAKVNAYADLYRFTEGQRDAFGRVANPEPVLVAVAVPLHRIPETSSSDLSGPDRRVVEIRYRFITSASSGIQVGDHLSVRGLSLVVTTVILTSADGILEFRAIASV